VLPGRHASGTISLGLADGIPANWIVQLIAYLAAFSLIAQTHPNPVVQFLQKQTNPAFKGLYQANSFDMMLLVPYFIVLIILAGYGFHRYQLVWMYYHHRKQAVREPKSGFLELPRITIQLPIFNEQFVIERLVESICKLQYPREKLDIQVLDDSTDETVEVARGVVERYKALGHQISYHHRNDRQGYKAGALREGLKTAKGEFVAIFDADFTPSPDWLTKVIHHFADPGIGMVQTRWTHINRNYSFLTEIEAILLDGHFVLEHGGRSRAGVFFNFNGTAGMWRIKAIEEAGGWQHDTLTEDTDLSYRAQLKGWKFLYLQEVECPAELPIEMTAFKTQQARWAKGLIQCAIKDLPQVMRSGVNRREKIEAWYHLTANLSYPLMILLSVLLLPAMVIRFYQGWFQMLYIDVPLFLASTFSISSFYLVSQKELYPRRWFRTFFYLPCLMALGIGLTITNSKAVFEALIGKQTAFARTPKYRVQNKSDQSAAAKKYRKRLGIVPWIELAIGCYFAMTVVYAVQNENYITVPFLILFVFGYWYTGMMSLLQGRFDAMIRSNPEQHTKPFPVGV
jgi:cellulose synthase/poly-beta-1,6-N-acetylglucosamine synthase-like glycosyltransferase